jgi:hypothetical protein
MSAHIAKTASQVKHARKYHDRSGTGETAKKVKRKRSKKMHYPQIAINRKIATRKPQLTKHYPQIAIAIA